MRWSQAFAGRAMALQVLGTGMLGLFAAYSLLFYWPQTTTFSYAGTTCITSPVILPNITNRHENKQFQLNFTGGFRVRDAYIYASRTCVSAATTPLATTTQSVHISQLGTPFFKKTIRIKPGAPPSLASLSMLDKPLPARGKLILPLTTSDVIFDYRLHGNNIETYCSKQAKTLLCDVAKLQLAQSKEYELKLERVFKNAPAGVLLQKTVKTVEPVRVVNASVSAGQTVYDIPISATITLDKSISSFTGAKLFIAGGAEIPTEASFADTVITLKFINPLPRSASIELVLKDALDSGGAYLAEPFKVGFQTSGGPKVASSSIGAFKVTANSFALTFDSVLADGQNLSEFIKLSSGAATVTKSGRTVIITPASPLPRCTSFTISVADGIKNEFGVSGGSAWQQRSRTICQTVFSIGASVQGRGITAYSFGSGPSKIIFTGAIHGNERSAAVLMDQWIEALEAGADRIPTGRTVIVIPIVNPDGYAANQRTNNRNVDLNRNFPSTDWKATVKMPDGAVLPEGGGSAPLSEPESKALTDYISSQGPRLVLNYHASGGIVSPNDAGDSQAIASVYAAKSSVGYLANSSSASFFEYDTTGAFESWLHDKRATPALIIELITKTGNEFNGHRDALWYIAHLP